MTSYDAILQMVSKQVGRGRLRLRLRKQNVGRVAACALDHGHRRITQVVDGRGLFLLQTNHLCNQFAARCGGLFAGELGHLLELFQNSSIIFPPVREHTARAVLHALFRVAAVAAAVSAQRVERTVAEQAVEVVWVARLVAGEELTLPVLKKRVMLALPVVLHDFSTFNFSASAASGVT